jgi:hypothetical protein
MRLTVGPLPAAIYWRRRAVVFVALAVMVLIVAYACSGGQSSAGAGPASPTSAALTMPTSASPTSTPLHRTIEPTTSSPTPTPFTLPHTAASGPCTDSEIALTATASPASVGTGRTVSFTLTIKNISTRTCARDIGAGPQELTLLDATGVTVWSSNDCSNDNSSDIETLTAGKVRSFTLTWNGLRSRSGTNHPTCTDATAPNPGDYQLIARLDTLKSAPFTLHITA